MHKTKALQWPWSLAQSMIQSMAGNTYAVQQVPLVFRKNLLQFLCPVSIHVSHTACDICIRLHFPVSAAVIEMDISSAGSRDAGESYSLTCSVHNIESLVALPVIIWLGPDNNPVVTEGSVHVGLPKNLGNVTEVTLEFDPLHAQLAGNYSCQTTITSTALSQVVNKTLTAMLLIQSKLSQVQLVVISSSILFYSSSAYSNCYC